jgi:hypothetical protein
MMKKIEYYIDSGIFPTEKYYLIENNHTMLFTNKLTCGCYSEWFNINLN